MLLNILRPRINERIFIPILLCVYSAYCFSPFMADGLPLFFDAHSHLTRNWFAAQSFEQGYFPDWSFNWYGGYRFGEYYGVLYYWLNGLVAQLTGDIIGTTKTVLWILSVASVLGFYLLILAFNCTPVISALAAILYLNTPVYDWIIGTTGNYPTTLLITSLIFLLLQSVRYANNKISHTVFYCSHSLLASFVLLSHFFNGVAVLCPVLAFQVVYFAINHNPTRTFKRQLLILLASYLTVVIATAFSWLPFFQNIENISLYLLQLDPPVRDWSWTPIFRVFGLEPYSWSYLFVRSHGLPISLLATLFIFLSALPSFRHWRPLSMALLVSFLAITMISDRSVIVLPAFLISSAALITTTTIGLMSNNKLKNVTGYLLVGSALLYFQSTTSIKDLNLFKPDNTLDDYKELAEYDTDGRTFDLSKTAISLDGFYGWSSFSPYYSQHPIVYGAFPQASSIDSIVNMALMSLWVEDSGSLSDNENEAAFDILYLNNVEFLLNRTSVINLPERYKNNGSVITLSDRLLKITESSPILFSPIVNKIKPESDTERFRNPLLLSLYHQWKDDPYNKVPVIDSSMKPIARTRTHQDWKIVVSYLEKMGIDRQHRISDQLYAVSESQLLAGNLATEKKILKSMQIKSLKPSNTHSIQGAVFTLISHKEQLREVELVAKSNMPGYARLSYSYDPDLRVFLDNAPVSILRDALGMGIVIDFPQGEHTVKIMAPENSIRKWATLISFGIILVLIGIWLNVRARSSATALEQF